MFTIPSFRSALLALICIALGSSISYPAAAVTVEVARKCKVLTDKAYPPREPGNPAAGSAKGTGLAAQGFFGGARSFGTGFFRGLCGFGILGGFLAGGR